MIQATNGKRLGARTVERPHDWDKVLSAAYLRLQGKTQQEVADDVGCVRQTVVVWEGSEFWPLAIHEATERWLHGLRSEAMTGVEKGVRKDGRLALDVLGRLMPELAPNAIKLEHTGDVNVHIEEAREQLRNRIRHLTTAGD